MHFKRFTQVADNLTFESPDVTFYYRVSAVIRNGDRILLQTLESIDLWVLPGGRVRQFESARDALKREMREESGDQVTVGALVAASEVLYGQTHEVNLCFEVRLPEKSQMHDVQAEHSVEEDGTLLIYRWFREDELPSLGLWPSLVTALSRRPAHCGYWFEDARPVMTSESLERNEYVAMEQRFATAEASQSAGIAYHLTPADVWERQKPSGLYLPEAFEQDGFIHTTNGLDPLLEVANLFYQGDRRDYRVLVLSVPKINADVRYDDDNRIYPHIYGPLNASAVVGELPVRRGGDGAFLDFE